MDVLDNVVCLLAMILLHLTMVGYSALCLSLSLQILHPDLVDFNTSQILAILPANALHIRL